MRFWQVPVMMGCQRRVAWQGGKLAISHRGWSMRTRLPFRQGGGVCIGDRTQWRGCMACESGGRRVATMMTPYERVLGGESVKAGVPWYA